MLSILIPTHDYTCYQLVHDLHEQAEQLGVPYEIIVAEDGSRSQVDIIANHKMVELSHCRHIVRKENVGQASTRNELAMMAAYDWLIIIDSDAVVEKKDFLYTYLNYIGKADVVVGGLYHQATNSDPNRSLRFKYEKEADLHRSARERSLQPYKRLTCFNIMLYKPTFLTILFDKDCHEYGYEDALFGVELEKRGILILHIDNPLMHNGLDTNINFLKKSETALRTLKRLNGKMESHSYVGRTMLQLRKYHLSGAMRLFFHIFQPLMRKNLLSKHPSLFLFSVYKLGYYSTLSSLPTDKV